MSIPHRKLFLTVLLFCPALLMTGCWLFLTVNVPYWDDYRAFIQYLSDPWPARWAHLFDFHNEHRIVTTRLIADALAAINGGSFNLSDLFEKKLFMLDEDGHPTDVPATRGQIATAQSANVAPDNWSLL